MMLFSHRHILIHVCSTVTGGHCPTNHDILWSAPRSGDTQACCTHVLTHRPTSSRSLQLILRVSHGLVHWPSSISEPWQTHRYSHFVIYIQVDCQQSHASLFCSELASKRLARWANGGVRKTRCTSVAPSSTKGRVKARGEKVTDCGQRFIRMNQK